MKYKLLLYGFLAAMITGCSSAYRASQTPDDVYYSPASMQKGDKHEDRYEDYARTDEDRYLRMKIRDRERWSSLDDYAYWNDSRYVPSLGYSYYHNNWNNPYTWNGWNSPYYSSVYLGSYGYYGGLYSGYYPGVYSYYPGSYSYYPGGYNVYVPKSYGGKLQNNVNRGNLRGYSNSSYSNSNNSRSNQEGLGRTLRRVFTPSVDNSTYSNRNSSDNSSRETYTPQRSYTPSSSSSSSSSSGSVSRPARTPRN